MATPASSRRNRGTPAAPSQTWQVGVITLPFLLSRRDGEPDAQAVALVVESRGPIRAMQPGDPEALPALLQATLQQAIDNPAVGCRPGPPASLLVSQEELHAPLLGLHPAIPTLVGPTPQLDQAAASLLQQLHSDLPWIDDDEDLDGDSSLGFSYLSEEISAEAMASVFAAAAALYRQAPWRSGGAAPQLFQLSCQALGMRGWIGCLMGDERDGPAILCFRSRAACDRYLRFASEGLLEEEPDLRGLPEYLALNYVSEASMPDFLLAEIRQHNWPVADADATPVLLRIKDGLMPMPLEHRHLLQLETMVRGLTALVGDLASGTPEATGPKPRRRLTIRLNGETLGISIGPLAAQDFGMALAGPGPAGSQHDPIATGRRQGATASGPRPTEAATTPAGSQPARQGEGYRGAQAMARDMPAQTPAGAEAEAASGTPAGGRRPGAAAPSASRRDGPHSPPAPTEPPVAPGLGRIPAALQSKVEALRAAIDPFCSEHLTPEYRQLIEAAIGALARKRPSPLLGGREPSWCAGIVHAVGTVNFLFDRSQSPHCKAPEIYGYFGVSAQTGQAHSKKVRDLLGMVMFDWRWTLPSRWNDSALIWMIQVDGFHLDARGLSPQIQRMAWEKGLIPYVPALASPAD